MHRIDNASATADNRFTEGNPITSVPATEVTADMMNALQEELVAVIAAAGIALNKAQNNQLLAAIQALIAGGGEQITAGAVLVTDTVDNFAGANVEVALAEVAQAAFRGILITRRLRRFTLDIVGPAHVSEMTHAESMLEISNSTAITYTIRPDAAVNIPVGTCINLIQAGAGKITIAAAAGVVLKKPAAFNAATMQQEAVIVLIKIGPNSWRLAGTLEAAA